MIDAGRSGSSVADASTGTPVHHRRRTCRACGSAALESFLSLGPQPLANALPRSPAEFPGERFFPLDVFFCTECALVQLVDVIDPEVLFGEYVYVSGTSETIAAHYRAYARDVVTSLGLGANDLVVEIASNDGSLLSCFASHGVRTLGVEPARNIAAMAEARGIPTVARFFDRTSARDIREQHGPASVVIGNNVLAHVDDTIGFLTGCRELLGENGRVVIEAPYAVDMLERREFDTVYHEHLCYFSVTSLARLAEGAGLALDRVDRMPVHGGSLRARFRAGAEHAESVRSMMAAERETGVTSLDAWRAFGRDAESIRAALLDLLDTRRRSGRTLAGYGAPAKGNTLLNFCGIGPDRVPFTVDRNPLKVGRLTPGTHIPVRDVSAIEQVRPDDMLILAWNFGDEIMRQQHAHRERGGRFILPIPFPQVL
jgi:hypothetical protein